MAEDKLFKQCARLYNDAQTAQERADMAAMIILLMEERQAEYLKLAKGPDIPKVKK